MRVVGAEPQVPVQRVGVDDLAGVHPVAGVEERLDLARTGPRPGRRTSWAAARRGLAVAVLAGQRAAVGDDEVGGAFDEGAVVGDAVDGAQLERDAGVHAALAEVPVQRGLVLGVAEVVEQRAEVAQVVAEPFGGDGGVLPALPGLVPASGVGGGTEAGLADLDQLVLLGRVVEERVGRRWSWLARSSSSRWALASASSWSSPANWIISQPPPPGHLLHRRAGQLGLLLELDQDLVHPLELPRLVRQDRWARRPRRRRRRGSRAPPSPWPGARGRARARRAGR